MSRAQTPTSSVTSGMAWSTLVLLCGLNLLNYLDRYVMSGVLTPLQRDLGLDDADAGRAASAFMLGYFLTAPVFGYLGDRYPRKLLMLGGVLVWSLATAASGLAVGLAGLCLIRVFVGVGEACFVTMGPSWISDLFSATRRNFALTWFYVAIPCGSAIGFTLGGWFAEGGSWRHAFFLAGAPGLLFALLLLLLREPARGEADGLQDAVRMHAKATWQEVLGLLLHRPYALLVFGYTAQTFAIGAFAIWGPVFLERVHGYSHSFATTVFGGMLAGTGLVATLLGGGLASSWRKRSSAGYVWVMALSMVLATPCCFFALLTGSGVASMIGLGLSMFFIFLPSGPICSEIFEIVPVHLRASAMALCTFVIHFLGDWQSPTLVGAISDYRQSLQTAVLLLPVALLVGAVLWTVLLTQSQRPLEVQP